MLTDDLFFRFTVYLGDGDKAYFETLEEARDYAYKNYTEATRIYELDGRTGRKLWEVEL